MSLSLFFFLTFKKKNVHSIIYSIQDSAHQLTFHAPNSTVKSAWVEALREMLAENNSSSRLDAAGMLSLLDYLIILILIFFIYLGGYFGFVVLSAWWMRGTWYHVRPTNIPESLNNPTFDRSNRRLDIQVNAEIVELPILNIKVFLYI